MTVITIAQQGERKREAGREMRRVTGEGNTKRIVWWTTQCWILFISLRVWFLEEDKPFFRGKKKK